MKTWKTLITATIVGAMGIGFAAQTFAQAAGPGGFGRGGEMPAFETLDADGDGNITIAEARAHAQARFAEADADGDGLLTTDELAGWITAQMAERAQLMAERMVGWQDQDGDGALSADEMPQARLQGMFTRLDADGDNQVSADEFAAARDRMAEHGRGFGRHGERGAHRDGARGGRHGG